MSNVLDCRLAFEFRRYDAGIQRAAKIHQAEQQRIVDAARQIDGRIAEKIARDMQVQPEPPFSGDAA